MREHDYQIIEHTADKGVRAYGRTLEEAFENAAYGMFSLMTDLTAYEPTETREIEVSGIDLETLFANWLRELLYLFEVEHLLPLDFHIREINEWNLRAVLEVRNAGPDVEWLGSPVKAVTYHEMKVEPEGEGWRVQAILDV